MWYSSSPCRDIASGDPKLDSLNLSETGTRDEKFEEDDVVETFSIFGSSKEEDSLMPFDFMVSTMSKASSEKADSLMPFDFMVSTMSKASSEKEDSLMPFDSKVSIKLIRFRRSEGSTVSSNEFVWLFSVAISWG